MSNYKELKRLCENCRSERCADEDEQSRNERDFLLEVDYEEILDLIAENERVNSAWHEMKQQLDSQKAENEALRKDADRYRHIREHSYVEVKCDSPRNNGWRPELLDICVDTAMSKEPS